VCANVCAREARWRTMDNRGNEECPDEMVTGRGPDRQHM
jgi:hypothetical protein